MLVHPTGTQDEVVLPGSEISSESGDINYNYPPIID
jgi:hypothetical protein